MKTFIILSDTHGNLTAIRRLKEIMAETDYIVHLGDYERDIQEIKAQYPNKVISVKGNCDGGGTDKEFTVENLKIIFTHGDRHGVKEGLNRLYYFAKERNANIVLYGHTHIANNEEIDGIRFVNAGTLSITAIERSYGYMVLHDGTAVVKIVKLLENF